MLCPLRRTFTWLPFCFLTFVLSDFIILSTFYRRLAFMFRFSYKNWAIAYSVVFGGLIKLPLMLKHFNRASDVLEIGDKPEEKLVNVRSFMAAGSPLTWSSQGSGYNTSGSGLREWGWSAQSGWVGFMQASDRSLLLVSVSRANLRKGRIDDEIW